MLSLLACYLASDHANLLLCCDGLGLDLERQLAVELAQFLESRGAVVTFCRASLDIDMVYEQLYREAAQGKS